MVCLVALSSGKLHCVLDPENCKDFWEAGAGPAPLPAAGRQAAFLSPRPPAAYPTVQVSFRARDSPAVVHLLTHLRVPCYSSHVTLIPEPSAVAMNGLRLSLVSRCECGRLNPFASFGVHDRERKGSLLHAIEDLSSSAV